MDYPESRTEEAIRLQNEIDTLYKEYEEELGKAREEYVEYQKHLKAMGDHQKQAQDKLQEIAKLIPQVHDEAKKVTAF